MNLVLEVFSNDDFFGPPSRAVVKIDDHLIERISRYRTFIQELEKDEDFYSIQSYFDEIEFGELSPDALIENTSDPHVTISLRDIENPESLDNPMLICTPGAFYFTAWPKGTSYHMETESVPYEILEEIRDTAR